MPRFTRHNVPVRNARGAVAPATRGQVSAWIDVERLMPDTSFYTSLAPIDVPDGTTREGVFHALSQIVTRQESLRTLFHRDASGAVVQTVCPEGEVVVEMCEIDTAEDVDTEALVERAISDAIKRGFDHAVEWPVRALLLEVDGKPRRMGLVISQMAADYQGQQVLARELRAMMSGRPMPAPAIQPIELAAREREPSGQRRLERSIEHWRRQLERMPVTLLPGDPGEPETPRYTAVWLRSRAAALAADALSVRYGGSSSAVLLAAMALLLGRAARTSHATVLLIAGNRTDPDLREHVGPLVQEVPATVDLTGPTFGDVIHSAWSASLTAYRNAQCDREASDGLRAKIGVERGCELDLSYYLNDTRPRSASRAAVAPGDIRAALPETRLGSDPGVERDNLTFFLRLRSTAGALELHLRSDSRMLPRDRARRFLRDLEALLVVAAEKEAADSLPELFDAADGLYGSGPDRNTIRTGDAQS